MVILDEPTNHLDVTATQVMERALVNFPGAVVAVSHDRFFIDKVATRLLAFEGPGRATTVNANWTLWQAGRDAGAAPRPRRPRRPVRASPSPGVASMSGSLASLPGSPRPLQRRLTADPAVDVGTLEPHAPAPPTTTWECVRRFETGSSGGAAANRGGHTGAP